MSKFTIIRDTREKKGHGWWFDESSHCTGTEVKKLDVGDYSIKGREEIVCIERKESVSEIAKNCGEKRFHRELEAMAKFPYAFLLLEFGWADIERYPAGSGIPYPQWKKRRIKAPYILSVLFSMQIEKGIHVIACGDKITAEAMALRILKKVNEYHV